VHEHIAGKIGATTQEVPFDKIRQARQVAARWLEGGWSACQRVHGRPLLSTSKNSSRGPGRGSGHHFV